MRNNHQEEKVTEHYARPDFIRTLQTTITKAYPNPTTKDFSAFDEFHTRGRAATTELLSLLSINTQDSVLDVGCGIGGTARYLSETIGCHVYGIDLTQEYIEIGKWLNDRVHLTNEITLQCADARKLPFDKDVFDTVITQHTQMNISDKECFYREIARVTKRGGRFAFHDVFLVQEPITYPVPWASHKELSFLSHLSDIKTILLQNNFKVTDQLDKTTESILFFEELIDRLAEKKSSHVGIELLMGEDASLKIKNYYENLRNGRLQVIIGAATKQPST